MTSFCIVIIFEIFEIMKRDQLIIIIYKISRQSIDILKESFRADLTPPDWQLIIKLKKILDIM